MHGLLRSCIGKILSLLLCTIVIADAMADGQARSRRHDPNSLHGTPDYGSTTSDASPLDLCMPHNLGSQDGGDRPQSCGLIGESPDVDTSYSAKPQACSFSYSAAAPQDMTYSASEPQGASSG